MFGLNRGQSTFLKVQVQSMWMLVGSGWYKRKGSSRSRCYYPAPALLHQYHSVEPPRPRCLAQRRFRISGVVQFAWVKFLSGGKLCTTKVFLDAYWGGKGHVPQLHSPTGSEITKIWSVSHNGPKKQCQERGLNTRPPELQSVALPAELSRHIRKMPRFRTSMQIDDISGYTVSGPCVHVRLVDASMSAVITLALAGVRRMSFAISGAIPCLSSGLVYGIDGIPVGHPSSVLGSRLQYNIIAPFLVCQPR
ncbi:hypothetical protein BD311DRAFT_743506 [Dichomitus squalens]|uniref:Uncharacterized protein n=1 Tax=Dichomitus squalens TaxID=114155 RepID=A0A4Q9M406_9APHY|nr:hypothetical protein BD311DRAFT_743506 [Dichomitus squalens]